MKENEVKTAPEPLEPTRWRGLETGLSRGHRFDMNPISLMKKFTDEMERFFHGFRTESGMWSPTVEVKEEAGAFRLTAELPGVKQEDVKVEVTEDMVILEGERKCEKEAKREGFYHTERSYGRFYRAIPLPKGADTEKAAAGFHNGVLDVTVPVPETKPKGREVPIRNAA